MFRRARLGEYRRYTAIHRANYDCNDLAIPVGVRVVTRAAMELSGS